MRLTSATGQIEGGVQFLGGGAAGDGCILTLLGVPDLVAMVEAGLVPRLEKDGCRATIDAAEPPTDAVPLLEPDPEIEAELRRLEDADG